MRVKDDDLARNVGECVDRLITVQYYMSGGGSTLARRPVTPAIYDAARALAGDSLSYLAAKALIERVNEGDTVLITTGLVAPPFMVNEGDGPVGAATLARAINIAFDATPVMVTEVSALNEMKTLCQAAGLVVAPGELAVGTPRKVAMEALPLDDDLARRMAVEVMDKYQPRALIAIEKLGANSKGVYHNGLGVDVSAVQGKVEHLFAEAARRGVLTITMADGGNEVGLGAIADTVREVVPTGANCGCPCGAGIAAVTPADYIVYGSKSNYGAFAVEACLAAGLKRPEILHSEVVSQRVHEAGAAVGLCDPSTGLAFGWDEFPIQKSVSLSVVDLIRYVVNVRVVPSFYEDAIMGSSRKWHQQRSRMEDLVRRWSEHWWEIEESYWSGERKV